MQTKVGTKGGILQDNDPKTTSSVVGLVKKINTNSFRERLVKISITPEPR